MNQVNNSIDFAFIDADNIYLSMRHLAKSKGLVDSEIDLVRFEYLIGNGGSGTWGWLPHARRFVYYADDSGETPIWLKNTEKADGFILRNGQLAHKSGGRSPKQQGVDVLLAVDAMQHSFRKSMTHCTLYTSDGDFLPLIDELVANGTFVRVKSFGDPDQGIVAPNLRRSADSYERIDIFDIYRALPESCKSIYEEWVSDLSSHGIIEAVTFHEKEAYIYFNSPNWEVLFHSTTYGQFRRFTFNSKENCVLMLKLGLHLIEIQKWKNIRIDDNYRL